MISFLYKMTKRPLLALTVNSFKKEKNMRKFLALILAALLALSVLAGCTSDGGNKPAETTEAGEIDQDAAAKAIADRKASGKMPTVTLCFGNFAGKPAGVDRIAAAMSKITEEKLGIKIELTVDSIGALRQQMNLDLASGNAPDLFNGLLAGYMPAINSGYLYDLEEDSLLQTYGQGILSAFREDGLNGCRVNGVLYGIPVKKDDAAGQFGISIPCEYLDTIGYDYASKYAKEGDELIYTDLDEIEGILTKLKEAYPDKTTFFMDTTSVVSQCLVIDGIGNDYFGALCDPINSLEVTNMFEDQQYIDLCKRMYHWNHDLGFFSMDAATTDVSTTVQVKSGSLCAYKTATKPGIKQQESNLCGMPVIIFQCGSDFKKSSTYGTMPWVMNHSTDDPVAAMQVLNELYTNPELMTLFCWGEEGVEWKESGDGHITFADGVDAQNSQYYNNTNWELPNQFIARVWEGDELTIWERMQSFNDNAPYSKAMGFTWENSDLANEYTALTNVYSEYQSQLELGFVDPEEKIPEMVERLKAAGLEKYMQAKKDAIEKWAAATGK